MLFHYDNGELRWKGATRVYRSDCGKVGMVRYFRDGHDVDERYFVWALSDSAPEYATWTEALAAAETLER